jgi:hypothetical protein
MNNEEEPYGLWAGIRFYIFMKLGYSLWKYVLIHADYWKHPYGISFTDRRYFPKQFKYDMDEMDDDLEVELNITTPVS